MQVLRSAQHLTIPGRRVLVSRNPLVCGPAAGPDTRPATPDGAIPAVLTQTVTFSFSGDLPPASFAEFAHHRARRLSLALHWLDQTASLARLRITGQPDLVDAFEMALSLGPQDCLVREVTRIDNERGGG